MKNFQVKYTKGHLINTETNKMILLKREGVFFISGDDDQFIEEQDEILMKDTTPLLGEEKMNQLKQLYPNQQLKPVALAGQKLGYRIGLGKKTSEDKSMEYFFEAVLLEDLYFHSKDNKDWKLCECLCETNKCLNTNFQMYEKIKGKSLNNLFSNIVTFYFPLQRSGACNAFNTFYLMGKDEHSPLSKFTNYRGNMLLSEIRNLFNQKKILQKISKSTSR